MLNTEHTQSLDLDTRQTAELSTSNLSEKSTLEHHPSQQFSTTSATKSLLRVEKSHLLSKKSERLIAAFINDPL
jgi:hypothetical protein